MKEKLVNIVYYFVDLLPPLVQHKIKIILNVLFHDWRISSMVMPGFDYYKALYGLSDEEIDSTYSVISKIENNLKSYGGNKNE